MRRESKCTSLVYACGILFYNGVLRRANNVMMTPDLDAKILAFIGKGGRDPRKGLDKGLRLYQDRLMDQTGPLTKIFDIAEEAHLNKECVNVEEKSNMLSG
ncbi:hypothetical protein NDU88_009933 [Pleurodeles waltl]|uniref:Uncharacterized protein n=1 Tax=Pleurodeles waltl TaxID=8319 RepID=A0AAV7PYL2_PLEWA|nr:hypothetical protein NDU88_009933 [Pleurodeles waltl]